MAQQATLVNKTWRELGKYAVIMQQLQKAHLALDKEINRWKVNVTESVNSLELMILMTAKIDDAFRSAQQTMDWVRMAVEDVSIGLAVLATGILPPELFPPSQL